MMKTVFFYGLFMDEGLLRQKGLHPANTRLARADGYGLRIGNRATLEPSPGETVHGVLMDMEDLELKALYNGESVADYVPAPVSVTGPQGEPHVAIAYILPMQLMSGSNAEYAGQLAQLAGRLGLPVAYVEEIGLWAGNKIP